MPDNRATAEALLDSHGLLEKGQRQLQEVRRGASDIHDLSEHIASDI